MPSDITGIHHVGIIVPNMDIARRSLGRLGFSTETPRCPAVLDPSTGEHVPRGVVNAHIEMQRGFLELVSVLDPVEPNLPDECEVTPLTAPPGMEAALAMRVDATAAALRDQTGREGAQILMFSSSDLDATHQRAASVGLVPSSIVESVRPQQGGSAASERIRYFDCPEFAEGRVGVVEFLPHQGPSIAPHPNAAAKLIGVTLGLPDSEEDAGHDRFEKLVGVPAVGPAITLDHATVRFGAYLGESQPGVRAVGPTRTTSVVIGITLATDDLRRTEQHLRRHGVEFLRSRSALTVSPEDALGCWLTFES